MKNIGSDEVTNDVQKIFYQNKMQKLAKNVINAYDKCNKCN